MPKLWLLIKIKTRDIPMEEQLGGSMGASDRPMGSFQMFCTENLHDPVALSHGNHQVMVKYHHPQYPLCIFR